MFGKKKKEKDIEQIENQDTQYNQQGSQDEADEFSDFFDADTSEPENNSVQHIKTVVQPLEYNNGEEVQATVEKPEMILYIVIDKPVFGLINYFRESGLSVSNIFSDITEAKNAVLMQSEPTRIVVVDTGLGKFTTTTMRAELIDMLGISDEQNKVTVFYTDSVLKVDTNRALGRSGRSIDWIQYKSTSVVVATILEYKEQYKYDLEDESDSYSPENELLNFKGLPLKAPETAKMDISGFSSDAIITHLVNSEDNLIPAYEVKL